MTASNGLAIGIDLGTTYSRVCVWQNNRVEIIPNEEGNLRTPSIVSFNGSERLVGDAAKNQLSENPANTIFDMKRLIGRSFSDISAHSDLKNLPYTVIGEYGDLPFVQVEYEDQKEYFLPEEISEMILTKIMEDAESYLGKKVKDAVITVPACFNDSQRFATMDAGRTAGLNVLQLITETTAVAIAYGQDQKEAKETCREKNVLIFNMGSWNCDVSLVTFNGGLFEVKATAGDANLSCEEFDIRKVIHLRNEFKRKHVKNGSGYVNSFENVCMKCESAKELLLITQGIIKDVAKYEDKSFFEYIIARAKFEENCMNLFHRTLTLVEKVLKDSKIPKAGVDDIVLVGGSTHMPKIQSLLNEFFNRKELCRISTWDGAVAYGAAIQAAIMIGDTSGKTMDSLLQDVAQLSLGIDAAGEGTHVLTNSNTTALKEMK